MTTQAQAGASQGPRVKRRMRNYLLVPGFQLKYTGAVVLVTILVTAIVGAWLGYKAYLYSHGMTEIMVMQGSVDDASHELLMEQAAEADRDVIMQIIVGILILVAVLAVSLGITGIFITHRVVGPVYKLKLLFKKVKRGNLNIRVGFRKGDELTDLGDAFRDMLIGLRERRREDLEVLEQAIATLEQSGGHEAVGPQLRALRDRVYDEVGDADTRIEPTSLPPANS